MGDDAAGGLEREIANALNTLANSGVEIAFIHGNRDFLLGADFCRRAGMKMLQQPHFVELGGTPTVLLHGDTLCTRDVRYQRYRRRVHDPDWQKRMLAKPVWLRKMLARALRLASRWRNVRVETSIADVTEEAVLELFRETGARRIIHGHTHRPGRHLYALNGQEHERIVLGDWYQQGSVLALWPGRAELQSLERG